MYIALFGSDLYGSTAFSNINLEIKNHITVAVFYTDVSVNGQAILEHVYPKWMMINSNGNTTYCLKSFHSTVCFINITDR
jgi:hypothetical protein